MFAHSTHLLVFDNVCVLCAVCRVCNAVLSEVSADEMSGHLAVTSHQRSAQKSLCATGSASAARTGSSSLRQCLTRRVGEPFGGFAIDASHNTFSRGSGPEQTRCALAHCTCAVSLAQLLGSRRASLSNCRCAEAVNGAHVNQLALEGSRPSHHHVHSSFLHSAVRCCFV